MRLISFDASNRQLSKLRNGHPVRIKKGTGFNLVVHPENYNLVSRAFTKNKGVQIKLTPEEIETNKTISPEEHEELVENIDDNLFTHLPFAEGGGIFKKIKKALYSKGAKKVGRELKPLTRALKSAGKEALHEQIADAHMRGVDRYGDDDHGARIVNAAAQVAHRRVGGMGLGTGLYAGRGMNAHHAVKLANMATAHANHALSKIHNASVHSQITQPPIRSYYDGDFDPPSRGSGIHSHHNQIRGRGSLLRQDDGLPPALQSQPYGANFHFQFQLPPQYKKYNDGTDVEGRGLYI